MNRACQQMVRGREYLVRDDHGNTVLAEFVGSTRFGKFIMATKNHTFTGNEPAAAFFRAGRLRELPQDYQHDEGDKPMRVNVEVRKRAMHQSFMLTWFSLFITGALLMISLTALVWRSQELRNTQARLDQALTTIDAYHRLIKRQEAR